MLRRWFLVLLTFVVAIALSGCNPTEFRSAAAQVPQLVYAIPAEPKTFNYVLSNESPNVFEPLYEGLITENRLTTEIEPGLAESWQEEKQRIVFTLREGLKWSDGQPLTVDDVLFTFNELYFTSIKVFLLATEILFTLVKVSPYQNSTNLMTAE